MGTCTGCVSGTTYGAADGSANCEAISTAACGVAVTGVATLRTAVPATATTDAGCAPCATGSNSATSHGACVENVCTASTAAAFTTAGCTLAGTATGTTVTALGAQTAAAGFASCAITCPAKDGAFTITAVACTPVTGSLAASASGVTPVVAAATLTCTTTADSRVSACAAATSKKTVGGTGATDKCTDVCAANTWDNSNVCETLTICGTQLKVGDADAVARLKGDAVVTTGLATANNVCDACIAGTYAADDTTNCAACTVTNSGTGATITCTSSSDARVSACATGHWKDSSGQADKCTAHTACGKQVKVGDADAAVRTASTAASATADAVCAVCTAGTYGLNSGDCTNCVAVDGAMAASTDPVVAAATYTCTSNSDSRVSACATATSKKTVGADGATDTCTA